LIKKQAPKTPIKRPKKIQEKKLIKGNINTERYIKTKKIKNYEKRQFVNRHMRACFIKTM
jgi:hypothetical protein